MERVIRNKSWPLLIILAITLTLPGCVYLVIGGIGAVGGYIASPDTVEGIYGHSKGSIWSSAMEILPIMGVVEEVDEDGGMLIAKVNGAQVTFQITPFGDSTSKVSVKARKNYLPKISVAQDVFVKVMSHIVTQ